MENELEARLKKQVVKPAVTIRRPETLLSITILTLEAIRLHISEIHPERFGDIGMLEDTIEVVKDYQ